MADSRCELHAIFIAYPLQGHVIPSVDLAVRLASRGMRITFINTQAVHHQSMAARRSTDPDLFAELRGSGLDIRYETISDGLPVGFDRSLNHDQFMAALLHVFGAHVDEAVGRIVEREGADFLIADTFFVWPSTVARKHGLVYVSFWTEPALVFSLYYHVDLLVKNGHLGCSSDDQDFVINYIPGVKEIRRKDMASYLQETNIGSICHQIIFACFNDVKKASLVICNTLEEYEPDTIRALRSQLPFYAIGPIFPCEFTKRVVSTNLWSEYDCIQWLDSRPSGSVLYISFGSYAHVTKSDLLEIASGLLLCDVSFVWVLRPDIVSSDDSNPLPLGFRERVSNRSIIVTWCSQRDVLAHKAVGGFLTHCGWNSILESLWCEVPLVCFPLLTDQFTNRKIVVDEWKVGINLCNHRLVNREEVSTTINGVMKAGETQDQLKHNIKKMKMTMEATLAPNGSKERNMELFVKDLRNKVKCK